MTEHTHDTAPTPTDHLVGTDTSGDTFTDTSTGAGAGTGRYEQGRHPVNIAHLVMGLAFLGMVGVWALFQADAVDGGDVRWLLPIPWLLAGLAGLLATTTSRPGGRA
jgi:hypothetical protein